MTIYSQDTVGEIHQFSRPGSFDLALSDSFGLQLGISHDYSYRCAIVEVTPFNMTQMQSLEWELFKSDFVTGNFPVDSLFL